MATTKSSLPTMSQDDERKVQNFLERAAGVILDHPEIDDEQFEHLQEVARAVGLTAEQLNEVLDSLRQRGVISAVPGLTWQPRRPAARPVPPRKPPVLDPRRVAPPAARRTGPPPVRREQAAAESTGNGDSPPPPSESEAEEIRPVQDQDEQPAAAAFEPTEQPADLSPLDEPAAAVAGPPPPATAPLTPADIAEQRQAAFQHWVREELEATGLDVLTLRQEDQLVRTAGRQFQLAAVLARQLIRDVAVEGGFQVASLVDQSQETVDGSHHPDSESQHHRLSAFLEEVAPIIALHRGINPQSRVVITAIAKSRGLTEAEVDEAIRLWQSDRKPEQHFKDPRQLERLESFRAYLRRAMAKLPHGIITFKTEQKLVEAGLQCHGVAEELIKPAINQVAIELSFRFITRAQAVEHIEQLVLRRIDVEGGIDQAERLRIYADGTQWGLDPIEVESIIRSQSALVQRQWRHQQVRMRWVLAIALTGLVVGVSFSSWVMLRNQFPRLLSSGTSDVSTPLPQPFQPPPAPVEAADSWLDTDLQIKLANARRQFSDQKDIIQQIRDGDGLDRGQAYRQLVQHGVSVAADLQSGPLVQSLLIDLIVREPDADAAARLIDTLHGSIPGLESTLQDDRHVLAGYYWAVETMAVALQDPRLDAERGKGLSEQLGALLRITPDTSVSARQLRQQCLGALTQHLYRQAASAARHQADVVARIYPQLSLQATKYLDAATVEKMDVDFLMQVLPIAGDQWRDYELAVQRCVGSTNPLLVLRMVDFFETTTNAPLQGYMSALLLRRVGLASGSLSVSDVAQTVRKSLGATADPTGIVRRRTFAAEAERVLAQPLPAADDTLGLLRAAVRLAYHNTLAVALLQDELGLPTFDDLQRRGVPDVRGGATPILAGRSDDSQNWPNEYSAGIQRLAQMLDKGGRPAHRVGYLNQLVPMVELVSDVDAETARLIAGYLMEFKSDEEEHQSVVNHADALARWTQVRIALADELEGESSRDEQLQQLLTVVLGSGAVDFSHKQWKLHAQQRLLQSALSRLGGSAEPRGGLTYYDHAAQQLVELFATQAKLWGVPPAEYAAAVSPAALLQLVLQQQATRVSRERLTPEAQAWWTDLPRQVKAALYAADDDPAQTVALSRLQLRLHGWWIVQSDNSRTKEVQRQWEQFVAEDQQPQRLLQQMVRIQAAQLRLNLLVLSAN